ncbi:hypothetical protein CKM354_000539200 [Cercospora kikuchii]|uniref:Uncharacterized protein n=1 Tax=Cercospora kikuchii TaxID=84275 RepID=A0A9P3CIQ8_9PEZI|nr:uncharacterized protein CKM354_000539200 [Cercospora kikuchii]GIZ42112.1 hypothetical protein CKM354_000539200 [Cercospora kikuchii]
MADWGTKSIGAAFKTSHSHPNADIDPSTVTLPKPFVVCIVGASRGIGAGVATSYAKAGCTALILASRRLPGLEETAAACKALDPKVEIEIISCDITSSASVSSLAEKALSRFGRLDAVVVNSGYSGPVKLRITETDPETFRNATNVNYIGTFYCAKFLIPLLLNTSDGAKLFIGVSSLASILVRGPIANTQYCVSKCAQLKLLEHVHEQYADQGLSSFAVHPGSVLSEMADETVPEEFRPFLTDSSDLCGAFCVWLTKEDRKWLSGRLLNAKWDVKELESKREEIVAKDALKLQLSLP